MKFRPKADTMSKMYFEMENEYYQARKEENVKLKLKQEKDNSHKFYEQELNHYKRQKIIFLKNLDNAKTDSEKFRFNKLLQYNEKNIEKTLLLIKQRDNVK